VAEPGATVEVAGGEAATQRAAAVATAARSRPSPRSGRGTGWVTCPPELGPRSACPWR